MAASWCEYAWLGGPAATPGVVLEMSGGVISTVGSAPAPPPGTLRLDGITLPGLANAHSHAFHRALRGRTQAGTGSFWTWRDQMYAAVATLEPDRYYALARAVFAEMVLAGITCVGEFHYVHHGAGGVPYADPNAMGAALVAAAGDAGLRLTLLDTCYLRGGFDAEVNDTQRRFSDGDSLSWATRATAAADAFTGPRVRCGAAIHSVRAVAPADLQIVAAWAAGREAPLHLHLSEQPAENSHCVDAYGCTPTQLLADRGVLSERCCAVHATHVSDGDIVLLGAHGTTICLCPTTERDLADGIGPAAALRDAGSPLALGSDSHAVVDLFEEARAVELDERLASLQRGRHGAASLLTAATVAGHRALGWPECGRIEVGARADLVTVGLDSVRLAGWRQDSLLESVVFAAAATDVRHVMVGGEIVVRDGRHVRIDVAAELRAGLEQV